MKKGKKLQKGKLYRLDGKPWRCVLVNECRAKLVPGWKEQRTIVERDGSERSFFFTPRAIDVSPFSSIPEWSS